MSSNESTKTRTVNLGRRPKAALAAISAALATAGAATALAAGGGVAPPLTATANADLNRYERIYEQARRYGVEPPRNLARVAPASPELGERAAVLELRVVAARGKRRLREQLKPDFGTPESVGVDQGTLDAIAACESGGDPTVVDASGTYYGKYQFDLGTWASVGGSGSPADASEAEQDYRAALLYSRAGASPWPVCG